MVSAQKLLKKQQKPLVVWFRLYDQEKADMLSLTKNKRGAHNAIALSGTLAEVARLKAKAAGITPDEVKAVADFRRLTGQCPVATLRAAVKQHIAKA